jgi:3-deoxy-D-manno-octulosonic-acid transferase
MSSTPLPYRALTALAAALAPLARLGGTKLREGHEGRRGAARRLRLWSDRHRDPARPLVWFHASSVGEGLQAEAVLLELRRLLPDAQYAYTHYSPSARSLARRMPVDVADFLPYDRPGTATEALDALRPDVLVFAKLDLWPELATRAAGRGTRVAIVAATVSPGSGRLRWPARALLSAGYGAVAAAGAIAEDDAVRLATLGVPRDRIRVLGDPRFDSVVARVAAVGAEDPLLRLGGDSPTMVAGSTWLGDERVLLAAYAAVRAERPDARLILVPHEPTVAHLAAIERAAVRGGLAIPVRLSAAAGPVPLLVIDRVGVLATLYGAGTMAYVGGGFGRAGLHSVLEPAAWSLPVAFGPRWRESRDAGLLLDAGAGVALPPGSEAAALELAREWRGWIVDGVRRVEQGRRARMVVERGLGAARRSAELLAELIESRPPRR